MHFNYSTVLWPRCEAVKRFETIREFDLLEIVKGSDQEFCEKFGIPMKELNKLKKSKKYVEEVDHLWVYRPEK